MLIQCGSKHLLFSWLTWRGKNTTEDVGTEFLSVVSSRANDWEIWPSPLWSLEMKHLKDQWKSSLNEEMEWRIVKQKTLSVGQSGFLTQTWEETEKKENTLSLPPPPHGSPDWNSWSPDFWPHEGGSRRAIWKAVRSHSLAVWAC